MEGAPPAAGNGRIIDPADFEAAFQQHFPPVYRFSAAGHRVFDLRFAPAGGTLTFTAVTYRSRTWWRGRSGRSRYTVARRPPNAAPASGSARGGWPAFIRYQLSRGEFTKGGQRRIGGIDAIQLTGNGGQETIWVNPRTYLPVRTVFSAPGGRGSRPTSAGSPPQACLAELRLPVPPGFRRVAPPAQSPKQVKTTPSRRLKRTFMMNDEPGGGRDARRRARSHRVARDEHASLSAGALT